ncbi:hypothetical protein [Pseudocalidococcus azoricus]|nr:hypothetical protein [Pseudocalidococcus azoricus]
MTIEDQSSGNGQEFVSIAKEIFLFTVVLDSLENLVIIDRVYLR